MSWFIEMINAALFMVFVQNFVFSGGYGVSETIRLAAKPKYLLEFGGIITLFTVTTSAISRSLELIPSVQETSYYGKIGIYAAVLFVVYCLVIFLAKFVIRVSKNTVKRITAAAFNTLVLSIPLFNHRAAAGFAESIGNGLGAGFAFVLAVWLVGAGYRILEENERIPKAFQGLPALFIYVSLISLALMGLAGHSLFV